MSGENCYAALVGGLALGAWFGALGLYGVNGAVAVVGLICVARAATLVYNRNRKTTKEMGN